MRGWSTDIAWFAGLYEGEGSLHHRTDQRNGSESWELAISSTDEDVIRKAHVIADAGNVRFIKRQQPHWSDKYRLLVSRRDDIKIIVEILRPHLGARRQAKVDEFLAWYATRQASGVTPHA